MALWGPGPCHTTCGATVWVPASIQGSLSLFHMPVLCLGSPDLMVLCTVASGPYAWKGRKAGYMENVDSPGTLPPTTSSATLVRVCHLLNLSFPSVKETSNPPIMGVCGD